MFCGRFTHSLDAKGRTSLPVRFRAGLDEAGETRLVVTTALDPCLVAYPVCEWRSFQARLAALPHLDPEVRLLQRCYVSGACELDADKHGRVVLAAHLRQYAGLEEELLWAGMGSFIEIWSPSRFGEMTGAALADPARKAALLTRLSELGI